MVSFNFFFDSGARVVRLGQIKNTLNHIPIIMSEHHAVFRLPEPLFESFYKPVFQQPLLMCFLLFQH